MSRYDTRSEREAVAELRRYYEVACDPAARDYVKDSEHVWRPCPDVAILGVRDAAADPLGSPSWVEVKRLSRQYGTTVSSPARGWRQVRRISGCVVLARIEGCGPHWFLFDPDEVCSAADEKVRGGVRVLLFSERLGRPVAFGDSCRPAVYAGSRA